MAERLELLVDDEQELSYYQTVHFLVSAIQASGGADQVVPALREVLSRTVDGLTRVPAGGAR